jgi:hypothetical protein
VSSACQFSFDLLQIWRNVLAAKVPCCKGSSNLAGKRGCSGGQKQRKRQTAGPDCAFIVLLGLNQEAPQVFATPLPCATDLLARVAKYHGVA